MRVNASEAVSGTSSATGTADTPVLGAPGLNNRLYVTSLIISNSSASATEVNIKDGSATVLTYPAPATGGAIHALPTPLVLSINSPLVFASVSGVTTMKVSAIGYKGQ